VAWQGLGFAADAQVVLQELEQMGTRPVTPEEAFTAWEHLERYEVAQAVMVPLPSSERPASVASDTDRTSPASWSQMPAEDRLSELKTGLRAILARELRMSASALNVDQPFPELGLDSMMAMTILRETRKLVGIDLSAHMLFDHPTIASLAAYLADLLAPPEVPEEDTSDLAFDSAGSVLDELFDSVESASAGSESGVL
jgi:phthiocerol/phenolphthiocerol synthesis type-I polyketide synthase A